MHCRYLSASRCPAGYPLKDFICHYRLLNERIVHKAFTKVSDFDDPKAQFDITLMITVIR
jgi:hypothetical protein